MGRGIPHPRGQDRQEEIRQRKRLLTVGQLRMLLAALLTGSASLSCFSSAWDSSQRDIGTPLE